MVIWLPQCLQADAYKDEAEFKGAAYVVYRKDFLNDTPRFLGQPIQTKRYPLRHGRCATFWHIITRDVNGAGVEEDRVFCPKRCARIPFPRALVDNFRDEGLKCWRARKNGEWRVYIFSEAEMYLVVLSERNGYKLLWTAFLVDRSHEREKLLRAYERAAKKGYLVA